jgi:hypothetical protein
MAGGSAIQARAPSPNAAIRRAAPVSVRRRLSPACNDGSFF